MKDTKVILHDVGLRDGLQSISKIVDTDTKIKWLQKLIDANVQYIQVGSFVNPKVLPQMADTDEIFKRINNGEVRKNSDTILTALILNEKGMERAINSKVDKILMGVSASETHSQKNTRMSVAEATNRIIEIAKQCRAEGFEIQVSVQSAFGCGFEGKVEPQKVLSIVEKYVQNGINNISLADTAGHANPSSVEYLFKQVLEFDNQIELACHFHNTYGMGMLNVVAAINSGVKFIESSFGGIGGCPFTKVPAGNVCTEDIVHYFKREGIPTGINLNQLIELSKDVANYLELELPGYVYKTGEIFWN